jgi:predicted nucleotidyltransferase
MVETHPVSDDIRSDILDRLLAIEAEHGVRVLYACESGSRGWGFASPDSDYDVRFIYAHPLPWYLRVSAQRDVIEVPISDELDINGWELRKALSLLKKGNATLIEWLESPVVYRADVDFLRAMRDAAQQTHQAERSFHHYVHMARKNYREYLRGDTVRLKKYLYVLRPLLATLWIEQGRGVAPMRFQDLVDAIVTDPALLTDRHFNHMRPSIAPQNSLRTTGISSQSHSGALVGSAAAKKSVVQENDFHRAGCARHRDTPQSACLTTLACHQLIR